MFLSTYREWSEDRVLRFSAALAYYSIFAMAPLVIIVIASAGLFFGEEAARGQLYEQIEWLIGPKAAGEIQNIIQASSDRPKSLLASIVGVATLILGASGVFGQLKDSLNAIWGVRLRKRGWFAMARTYLLSFSMVLAIGFLLMISLVLSAVLQAISNYMSGYLPLPSFAAPLDFVLSIILLTVLFALIYKVLPDVRIQWRDVWIGAAVTAVLFAIGKMLIGWYLGTSSVASSFGAAGALILILVWVYYSTTIFLFGAEFTKEFSRCHGSGIVPSAHAEFIDQQKRAEQGLGEKKIDGPGEGKKASAPRSGFEGSTR